jgi:hypothetical protein
VNNYVSTVSRYPPMEAYESNPQLGVPYTPPHTPPGFSSILIVHSYQSNGWHLFANTTPLTYTPPGSLEYCWNTPITFAPINTPPSSTLKRQCVLTINDENTPAESHSSKKAKTSGTSTRRKPHSAKEKVKLILKSIQNQG